MNHPLTQNGINALAVTAPVVSIWSHAPEIVTVVVGVLGIVWYTIIILEKVLYWVGNHTITDPLEANEPPPTDLHKHG